MNTVDSIKSLLTKNLQATVIDITDLTHQHAGHKEALASGGGHYRLTVVSPLFKDQPAIKRHRMLYEILKKELRQEIHALSITALTPQEHQKQL